MDPLPGPHQVKSSLNVQAGPFCTHPGPAEGDTCCGLRIAPSRLIGPVRSLVWQPPTPVFEDLLNIKQQPNWEDKEPTPNERTTEFSKEELNDIEASNLSAKNQTIQLKNGQRTWIDSSAKRTYRWSTDLWKDAQRHWSSEKCKLKRDIISHLSEWPSSINQQTSDSEDVEKGEPFCTVGGDADWCSHCGKQHEDTSKN